MKIINFFVCDDIRNEVGNKQSIIGLYDENINFNVPINERGKWPKSMKLAILFKAKFDNEKEKEELKKFRFEIVLNGNVKTIAADVLKIEEKKNARGVKMAFQFNPFVFEGPGLMIMKLIFMNDKDEIIAELEAPETLNIQEGVAEKVFC